MKKVLTIAGSDSGGGAGIQADLKSFAARGVFGMCAVTALTAQNTVGVQGLVEIEPHFVSQQIDSVMMDMGADAWKTGMLANAEIIRVVVESAKEYNVKKIIVDPVMVARGGEPLLHPDAVSTYISELFPLALIVTPNCEEAAILAKIKISDTEDMKTAAKIIKKMGPENVIIKGGHFEKENSATDILYDGHKFTEFGTPQINTENTHGTGCTFASALAAEIAKGSLIEEAIRVTKAYVTAAIIRADSLSVGVGRGPIDHSQGSMVNVDLELVSVK
jgi:hydroxymethylpyrimidine/phosphomethylpyrimidine kinase